jgi:hypothetical protein
MHYSNQRRHNLPSISQTQYQTLIIPCPSYDPIYQVILLENSNKWNLSPAKRRILEKKNKKIKEKEHGLKSKKCETSFESSMFQKRKRKK